MMRADVGTVTCINSSSHVTGASDVSAERDAVRVCVCACAGSMDAVRGSMHAVRGSMQVHAIRTRR